jgi:hypothetical protein
VLTAASTGWYVAVLARLSPRGHLFYLNSVSSVCSCVDEDDVMVAETTTFYEAIGFTIWHTWVSWVNQLTTTMMASNSTSGPSLATGPRVRRDWKPVVMSGTLLLATPILPRRRRRSLASHQRPRKQLRVRNESMMIRRMIPTRMMMIPTMM